MSLSLFDLPLAVTRLGDEIFLQQPLFPSRTKYHPVYINAALFESIFGSDYPTWQDKASLLSDMFSVTLQKLTSETTPVGWAYIDRQTDPLGISMGGNIGSGRAYYTGSCFNIKGEKTPFATSDKRKLSDGLLEAERGIWETLVSNVLDHDLDIGVPPVLAILDMKETCHVEWREEAVERVKIIRIDRDGALDRITHLFQKGKSLTSSALTRIAEQFGKQSAEKFMERILHGAWSPGNVSPDGHIIDFDTVCAVKGRCARHSLSRWHIENYFGHEHKGHVLILQGLANASLNKEALSDRYLHATMLFAYKERAIQLLPHLMGFQNGQQILDAFHPDLLQLFDEFFDLSPYMYPKFNHLSARETEGNYGHIVDFSAFFRLYPLLRRSGFDAEDAADRIMENTLLANPLAEEETPHQTDDEKRYFQTHVAPFLEPRSVRTEGQYEQIRTRVIAFAELYDRTFSRMFNHFRMDMNAVERRAYIINEDRHYLFPAYSLCYALATELRDGGGPDFQVIIDTLITANFRNPRKEKSILLTNIRIFKEGFYALRLAEDGTHRHSLSLFRSKLTPENIAQLSISGLRFSLNGQSIPCFAENTNETIDMVGQPIDNLLLLNMSNREQSLKNCRVDLYTQSDTLVLTNYL